MNQIVHIPSDRIVQQRIHTSGYCMCTVSDGEKQKNYLGHRFIYECINGIIPHGYEIDHINRNNLDNKIDNLRCITIQENRKNKDHTNIINFARISHTVRRFIKSINIDTNEIYCFNCKNQCGKYFGISAALIYLIVENKNMVKTANTNKGKVIFEYIDEKRC